MKTHLWFPCGCIGRKWQAVSRVPLVLFRLVLLLIPLALCAGCGAAFFYPQAEHRSSPSDFQIDYHDIHILTADGVRLHGWYLPAVGQRKGTVLHFHGNAENISTHIFNVYWLPAAGYDVITFDYRGFGLSEGRASLPEVIEDGKAAISYAQQRVSIEAPCLFIFGQSMGGAVALLALEELSLFRPITALVLDSSFTDFREIMRDIVGRSWLMRPVLPVLSLLVPNLPRPVDILAKLKGTPVLLIHGMADRIVPIKHSRKLYLAAQPPKAFWEVPGGQHIDAVSRPAVRRELLDYFELTCGKSYKMARESEGHDFRLTGHN